MVLFISPHHQQDVFTVQSLGVAQSQMCSRAFLVFKCHHPSFFFILGPEAFNYSAGSCSQSRYLAWVQCNRVAQSLITAPSMPEQSLTDRAGMRRFLVIPRAGLPRAARPCAECGAPGDLQRRPLCLMGFNLIMQCVTKKCAWFVLLN